jgi:putative ABC transport system substrate-binding protein
MKSSRIVHYSKLGFVDGQNITIEYRWTAGQYERLSEMAADLVRRDAAVIAVNTLAVIPAERAIFSIPISPVDPGEASFVTSLSRSGDNPDKHKWGFGRNN